MSMMASATPENTTAPTIGLVAVTLPADTQPLRHVWIDEHTLMVGYDPEYLNEHLVGLWLDTKFPAGYQLAQGVPA